jgi:hypothetical protein
LIVCYRKNYGIPYYYVKIVQKPVKRVPIG